MNVQPSLWAQDCNLRLDQSALVHQAKTREGLVKKHIPGREHNPIPSVSVIVPVFNTAGYVEDCLRSLQDQGNLIFEAIVVDDGSTDQSHSLILKFSKTDSRFRVIHQPNLGLSGARNTGLQEARGEYVFFLDSDDIVTSNSLDLIFREAKQSGTDVQCFRSFPFSSAQEISQPNLELSRIISLPRPLASGPETLRQMALNGTWRPSATQYLIRREFLIEHSIRFKPGILYEDNPFTFEVLTKANSVGVTDIPVLGFRLRADSITRQSPTVHHIESLLKAASQVREIFHESRSRKKLADNFAYAYVQQNIASQLRSAIKRYRKSRVQPQNDARQQLNLWILTPRNLSTLLMLSALTKSVRWVSRLSSYALPSAKYVDCRQLPASIFRGKIPKD